MTSDAQYGFMSEAQQATVRALEAAANDAVSNQTGLRLVLKGGEVVQGVPDRLKVDASKRPSAFSSPLAPEQREHFGPREVVVEIAGIEILAQEVESFSVIAA